MSVVDARNKINKIKESTQDYQTSINGVQSKLLEFISEMNSHSKAINEGLLEESLINYSSSAIKNVVSDINSALSISKQTLDSLSKDATEEIKRIVDEHNNSIDPDAENPEPTLNYETISLSSIAGVMDADSGTNTSTTTDTSSSNGNHRKDSSNGYDGSGGYIPPEPTFETILATIGSGDVHSDQIANWDQYVKDFLAENNLVDVIEDIQVDGTKIICKLKNGKDIVVENVTTVVDLLKAIRDELQKM